MSKAGKVSKVGGGGGGSGVDMGIYDIIYFTPDMDWERSQRSHVLATGYQQRAGDAPLVAGLPGIKMTPERLANTPEARSEKNRALRNRIRDEKRHYEGGLMTKSYLDDYF